MAHTKTEWRALLAEARRALEPAERVRHSAAIVERVCSVPELATSRSVLTYEPVGAEVDASALTELAGAMGKIVYAPLADGGEPRWVPRGNGRWASHAVSLPEPPVFALVPGVGFDLRGVRLGRGGGFYDRALATLRGSGPVLTVGLAFEVQVVERLPRESWDQPVDLLATERRVITPRRAAHARFHAEEARER
jgi:5-formyltetrahydrofolate cyclo-ligase